jgi:hypothetical protein
METTNHHLPTRLVDIGTRPDAIPKLILTKKLRKRNTKSNVRYAALSYCWGLPDDVQHNVTTTQDSLDCFLKAIDKKLPAVIEDTIIVCRALSIRYLWVDTLCIIQNNSSDWERESQNMGVIYLNSLITICPLSSESCLQGFLRRQVQSVTIPFQSKLNNKISGSYKLEYLPTITEATENVDIVLDITSSRWSTRGWTLQELYMSRRVRDFCIESYFQPEVEV